MVEVAIDLAGQRLVARVTRDAVEELKLAVGAKVVVLIKASAFEATAAGIEQTR